MILRASPQFYDIAGKPPVLGAFDKGDLLEATDVSDIPAHLVHARTVSLASGLVGIDKKPALCRFGIGLQGFDDSAGMFGTVVNE